MINQRSADWPERLADMIEQRRSEPFAWGANDCCLFPADVVRAMTGFDFAAAWRGQYDSAIGAQRQLDEAGGMVALVTAALGAPRDNPQMAVRGDVVCVDIDGRLTLGVVTGSGSWCAPGESGLIFRPMSEVQMVWEV